MPSSRSYKTSDGLGTTGEQQRLAESCQGLVRMLAWKIHQKIGGRVELDDLIGYGHVGLMEAARKFDVSRGANFTTYAYYRIRGSILNGLDTMSWFKRHAYHANLYDQHAQEIFDLEAEYGVQNQDKTEDNPWLVSTCSTLAVISLVTQSGGQLPDQQETEPSEHLIFNELKGRLHQLVDALPGEAGQLIQLMYFNSLSLTEAAKSIGISKSWASRLHAKTLQRLGCSLRLLGEME